MKRMILEQSDGDEAQLQSGDTYNITNVYTQKPKSEFSPKVKSFFSGVFKEAQRVVPEMVGAIMLVFALLAWILYKSCVR